MAVTVRFRPAAEADLIELYGYIAERSGRARAGDYIDRIEAACLSLADFPERGTRRDDLRPGLRVIGFERRVATEGRTAARSRGVKMGRRPKLTPTSNARRLHVARLASHAP